MALGKLAASSPWANILLQPIPFKSHCGPISLLSTASSLAAASKKPSHPADQFDRFISPRTILTCSPAPSNPMAEKFVWRTALQDFQKKKNEEINNLQWILDSLRIAQLPTDKPTTAVVPKKPTKHQLQQHTFQVMNRNARKPKRANHGKRPNSRIRRRYKFKKWANTSRRG